MTATQLKTFKQELKSNFIPAIERMIQKEKDHLAFLRESNKKFEGLPLIGNMLMNRYAKFNEYHVEIMIEGTERNLRMLELRLEDYKKYAKS